MGFLTRRVLLIALIISFVPCLCVVLPYLVFVDHDDPVLSLLVVLVISTLMFVMGLGVQYIDSLRDNRDK